MGTVDPKTQQAEVIRNSDEESLFIIDDEHASCHGRVLLCDERRASDCTAPSSGESRDADGHLGSPSALPIGQADVSSMRENDPLDDRQPESVPPFAAGQKRGTTIFS